MAGDPAFTELLLAMGLRSFSMHPSQIAAVKQRVLRADTRALVAALPRVLAADDPERELRRRGAPHRAVQRRAVLQPMPARLAAVRASCAIVTGFADCRAALRRRQARSQPGRRRAEPSA